MRFIQSPVHSPPGDSFNPHQFRLCCSRPTICCKWRVPASKLILLVRRVGSTSEHRFRWTYLEFLGQTLGICCTVLFLLITWEKPQKYRFVNFAVVLKVVSPVKPKNYYLCNIYLCGCDWVPNHNLYHRTDFDLGSSEDQTLGVKINVNLIPNGVQPFHKNMP